ncbi:uncharacterized protein LOC132185121 [Corylus avellana]|uniref:uncharacterized protein LOC132185121 n=1 Tax=Corylus avellana TaxID=13451 RepID=UPI00286C30D5|nr:uncharacterized protein LOC132185121 [Corylus avellana]
MVVLLSASLVRLPKQFPCFTLNPGYSTARHYHFSTGSTSIQIIFADKWNFFRSNALVNYRSSNANNYKATQLLQRCSCVAMCASHSSLTTSSFGSYEKLKTVWMWTKSKEVMTAAVERGWNTFVFSSQDRQLANEWSSIALISPLYIEEGGIFDGENRRVATVFEVSNPQDLQQLQPANGQAENVVINLLDWQVIPAENIVAAFQGSQKTVFAISKNHSEAQVFLEALEQGLGGVILKVENTEAVFQLKDYFDRRNELSNLMSLTKATVTRVQVVGMGDRVCVDLCSLMRPGEGLLVCFCFLVYNLLLA